MVKSFEDSILIFNHRQDTTVLNSPDISGSSKLDGTDVSSGTDAPSGVVTTLIDPEGALIGHILSGFNECVIDEKMINLIMLVNQSDEPVCITHLEYFANMFLTNAKKGDVDASTNDEGVVDKLFVGRKSKPVGQRFDRVISLCFYHHLFHIIDMINKVVTLFNDEPSHIATLSYCLPLLNTALTPNLLININVPGLNNKSPINDILNLNYQLFGSLIGPHAMLRLCELNNFTINSLIPELLPHIHINYEVTNEMIIGAIENETELYSILIPHVNDINVFSGIFLDCGNVFYQDNDGMDDDDIEKKYKRFEESFDSVCTKLMIQGSLTTDGVDHFIKKHLTKTFILDYTKLCFMMYGKLTNKCLDALFSNECEDRNENYCYFLFQLNPEVKCNCGKSAVTHWSNNGWFNRKVLKHYLLTF